MSSHSLTAVEIDAPRQTVAALDADVLGRIFEINGNPLTGGGLSTLRWHSQVCHAWRSLALGSPHLWGRLIDLQELMWLNSRSWADEVVRRAGPTSSLWITGPFIKRELGIEWFKQPNGVNCMRKILQPHFLSEFFFELVTSNWSRVERFVVDIGPDSLDAPRWSALCTRPSPNLREFKLSGVVNNVKQGMAGSRIFSNFAPRLTKFIDHDVEFDVRDAPWLSHIRSLSLSLVTPDDLLLILQSTTLLEDLDVKAQGRQHRHDALAGPIVLKASKQVNIEADFKDSIYLLASLVFARGCKVTVSSWFVREFPTLEASMSALVNLSKTISTTPQGLQMEATMKIDFRKLASYRGAGLVYRYVPSSFSLEVLIQDNPLTFEISGNCWRVECALPSPFPNFITVDHLKLDLSTSFFPESGDLGHVSYGDHADVPCGDHGHVPYSSIPSDYYQMSPVFSLSLILCTASQAKSLHTTAEGVFHLLTLEQLRRPYSPLLPFLKILKLSGKHQNTAIHLVTFLRMRRHADCAIDLLDLVEGPLEVEGSQILPDLIEALNEFSGMKILWCKMGTAVVQEHVCRIN